MYHFMVSPCLTVQHTGVRRWQSRCTFCESPLPQMSHLNVSWPVWVRQTLNFPAVYKTSHKYEVKGFSPVCERSNNRKEEPQLISTLVTQQINLIIVNSSKPKLIYKLIIQSVPQSEHYSQLRTSTVSIHKQNAVRLSKHLITKTRFKGLHIPFRFKGLHIPFRFKGLHIPFRFKGLHIPFRFKGLHIPFRFEGLHIPFAPQYMHLPTKCHAHTSSFETNETRQHSPIPIWRFISITLNVQTPRKSIENYHKMYIYFLTLGFNTSYALLHPILLAWVFK
jgi:hypothetical protein